MQHPIYSGNEPNHRFLPARNGARLVARHLRAMSEGMINPPSEKVDEHLYPYEVWADQEPKTRK